MRRLTARQFLALVLVLALGAGVVTAAAVGRQSLAIALVGSLMVVTFGAVLQLGRRLGQGMEGLGSLRVLQGHRHLAMREEIRALHAQVLSDHAMQERIVAAVESERQEIRALHAQVLSDHAMQERIVAAVESERQPTAERQEALLSTLRALKKEVHDERVAAAEWHQALLTSLRNLRGEMQRTRDEV